MCDFYRNQFYKIFYGVFDNQFAAMDALLNGKELFARQVGEVLLLKFRSFQQLLVIDIIWRKL